MSSLPSSSPQDIRLLKEYISKFALRPNYLFYKGKALVSTFAGENSLFGCDDIDSAWTLVKRILEEVCPVIFVPSFFVDPRRLHSMKCIDGAFNWNGSWPIQLSSNSPKGELPFPRLMSDVEYIRNIYGKTLMTSVSPWFFTHYGEDSWNKNWIYRCDDWLLVRRWEQMIAIRDLVDIVQIISWNDYGESHYVGPIKGAQPNSEAWVNGFDHTAWLHLCGYFSRLFKKPETLTTNPISLLDDVDRVFVWARPHPRDAKASEDPVGRPKNWDLTEDMFWVVILAHAPAHVLLWSSNTDTNTCSPLVRSTVVGENLEMEEDRIPAGLTQLSCPLVKNGGINVQLIRGGRIVLHFHPVDFVFEAHPKKYNFNAYVAMYPC
ncbi:uncharacterized protein FOMMEDRAFT_101593 [Fomitiporia mediterranea MF3/22]|uniref:uncharacterized protein n=1 Tax=Fomitiporia mediterranea (strain MF3/22) TaxID=694068 RepID=UPI000440906C|nr:uncharacterized protein FOMMEDRAFT_101593 [Fomitiporia mediterranea MF3/22]EJD08150.1 hypothetical protein FOMMEDRAFT_101593 [Fomitiporia mediterranea MF3/22]